MNTESSREDLEYWKAKYLRLLDADEMHRTQWEQRQGLLSKAVTRLTLLAEGLDAALDPHLRAIRDLVRNDELGPELLQKLDALLETLIRAPEQVKPADSAAIGQVVIRFLESLDLDTNHREQLKQLRWQIEAGTYPSEAQLFAAAQGLLSAEPQQESPVGGLLSKLLGRGGKSNSPIEPRQLCSHLADLLVALKLPLFLDERRSQLLRSARDGNGDLLQLIDGTAALLADLGQETDKEHSQLKDFLTTLSGKLVDLEEKTLGMGDLAEDSSRSRIEADEAVSGQVADMRAMAMAATDLTQFQTAMAGRLDGIAYHLEASRQAEQQRFAQTQQQVRELADRLQAMEQETLELRNQLLLANDKAFTDALTRLPNRAAYQERVALEEMRWKRFQHPLSLLIWDIDFFKDINDRFGHPAGDKALQVIAEVLQGAIRGTDFLARVGGEEFVMLLSGANASDALEVADNIRRKVEECAFTSEGRPITITVSCGIAVFSGADHHEQAYTRADQALYQAKRAGRNRCVVAEDGYAANS